MNLICSETCPFPLNNLDCIISVTLVNLSIKVFNNHTECENIGNLQEGMSSASNKN